METVISWALFSHTIFPRWPLFLCCLSKDGSHDVNVNTFCRIIQSKMAAISFCWKVKMAPRISWALFSHTICPRWPSFFCCLSKDGCHDLNVNNFCIVIQSKMVAISFLLKSQYGACYLMGIVFTMWHSFLCWANNDSCHSVNVIIFGIWRYFNGYVSFAILIWLPWRPSICFWLLIIFNMPSVSLLCKFNMAAVMSCDFCVTSNGCRAWVTVHAFTLIACSLVLTTFLTCLVRLTVAIKSGRPLKKTSIANVTKRCKHILLTFCFIIYV